MGSDLLPQKSLELDKTIMSLTGNEAAKQREVTFNDHVGLTQRKYGHSSDIRVTERGIILVVSKTRIFIPWHNVTSFQYHVEDMEARRIVEGIEAYGI
jgi:hypothetical protein